MSVDIPLLVSAVHLLAKAKQLSSEYGFVLTDTHATQGFELLLDDTGLQLFNHDEAKQKPIMVDFVSGANAHRVIYPP
jgi:hypothetical protein